MPYIGNWVPAADAIARVMRVDGCDRAAAMHQIEAAVRDGALRWFRRGSDRWDLDAEVFRADLIKLWPNTSDGYPEPGESENASKLASTGETLRDLISEAQPWQDQPLPTIAELGRFTELITGFWNLVRREIRIRERDPKPEDQIEPASGEAVEDATTAVLGWLWQGSMPAFLHTARGLEVLPYGPYWRGADGSATSLARQALSGGTVPSCRHSGLTGVVKLRKADFNGLVGGYMADHGFEIANSGAGRFVHPVWDLRDVFGWVLDRDSARFGRINSETDWRSAAWRARFYTAARRAEFDPLADQTLLHALQRGELTGYNGTSAIPRDFWIDKTVLTLRGCAANFYREEVPALWPDLHKLTSRVAPATTPAEDRNTRPPVEPGSSMDRSPSWTIWKNVTQLSIVEAVALSLNIDPQKLRPNTRSLLAGRRSFYESQEFKDRLFLAERNLPDIGVSGSIASYIEGREPVVRLDSFVRCALRVGWILPAELMEAAVLQDTGSPPAEHPRHIGAVLSGSSPSKASLPGRAGRKKGSGSADDAGHLRAMLRLLASGQAPSVYAAAQQVADTMLLRQSRAADIARLRRKFAKEYGTEPPAGKSWSDVEAELDTN